MAKLSAKSILGQTALMVTILLFWVLCITLGADSSLAHDREAMQYRNAVDQYNNVLPTIQECQHNLALHTEDCLDAIDRGIEAGQTIKDYLNAHHQH